MAIVLYYWRIRDLKHRSGWRQLAWRMTETVYGAGYGQSAPPSPVKK